MSFDPVSYLLGKQAGGGGGGGGPRVASGEFTLVNAVTSAEIVHGLDTQNVFVTLQRVNENHIAVVGSSRYQTVAIATFDPTTLIDLTQDYVFGSDGSNQKILDSNDSQGGNFGGISTYFGATESTTTSKTQIARPQNGITSSTNNSVEITPNYQFTPGRWVWKVYKLG